jgi:hypothetical protein
MLIGWQEYLRAVLPKCLSTFRSRHVPLLQEARAAAQRVDSDTSSPNGMLLVNRPFGFASRR